MELITSWDKFRLLIWKNCLLLWNQKFQLFIELVLPAVFSLFLVVVRILIVPEPKPVTIYEPQDITNINLFKSFLLSHLLTDSTVVYKLGYSPINPLLEKIVQEAATSLELVDIVGYNTASQMQAALELNGFIAGVQFDDNWHDITDYPVDFSFALRFPSELRTITSNPPLNWMTNKLFMPINLPGPRNAEEQDGGVPVGYLREAFLPIQNAITMAYMKHVTGNNNLPLIHIQRYPYPDYIFDPLLVGFPYIMSLVILMSFIYPCINIVTNITAEKEKQLKEVMKIMGLNNWIHWAAWFVKSFIMLFISAILITILMKIRWVNDVAVLTFADWSVLLFFLSVYVITSICFCFMIATFFSKATTAAAVTSVIFFIAYMPYTLNIQTYDDLSFGKKLGECLLSNTAMGFAFKLILEFEANREGLQWSNLFTPVNIDDNLTVGYIILMMLASCVIYICICLYVEQIFPGEYGVPKKWNFIFTKQFWGGGRDSTGVENIPNGHIERHNPAAFEPESTGKNVGIQVKNLKKKFGDKVAVNNLSVKMYEDEITVLLGHNGAGKTTTISMLTGMLPPTKGTAIINGSDIRTNIEGARMSLGVCPQHNVLFDDLTVAEHLIFFSRLKGLKGEDIQKEVDKYVRMIELEDKANVASKKLSGGMKRKLSVCCALAGSSKVVLCDEPSSGMDPSARRQLWNILQNEKKGRTLLLTTHLMDEADVLGDRIAILCEGELKCHGTSFFLKKKYGSGYRLICAKGEGCVVDKVTALLQNFIPGIQPKSDIGAELMYELPNVHSNRFEQMFSALDRQSNDLKLNGYGISITSLENVFMKVGAENINNASRKPASAIMNGTSGYQNDNVESTTSESHFSENTRLLKGTNLLKNQWHAMILKKFLYTNRNQLLFLIQNILPILFVSITIIIASNKGTFNQMKPLCMSLTQYPQAVIVLDTANDVTVDSLQYRIAEKYRSVATSYGSDYKFVDTGSKAFSEFILDLGGKIQKSINSRYLASATISNENIIAWLNNQPLHTAPLTVNLVHNAMIKALMDDSYKITVTNAPLPFKTETVLQQLDTGNNLGSHLATNLCFCFCIVSAFYILFLIKERVSRFKLLQFVGGVKVWTFWLSQLFFDILTFAFTAIMVIVTIFYWQENRLFSLEVLAHYFLVIVLFGFSVLPFTYIVSFFFTEPATGFSRISLINIFAALALFIMVLFMAFDLFDKNKTELLISFLRIFPHFSLGMALNKLYVNAATRETCSNKLLDSFPPDTKCQIYPQCCKTISYFAWEEPGVLPEIVYMVVTAVVFFLIIIIREYKLLDELIYKFKQMTFKPPPPPEDGYFDDGVDQEKQRILNMTQNELSATNLVLDRVTKYYDKFLAVNQVSLCVKPIECFGLLGVNGAGKTTTFKMMTGDERITFGSAYVKGLNLSTDLNKIYKEIGYCPQFDALLEDLTGRETLKIFCLLRGIHKERIPNISEELAESFGFMKHLDKPIKAYSGGNKRKLSTAISVIGSPSVIYLDEPTTGMDPAARRQIWNMVCRMRDSGKSIVLTSHSMEECEALCTRLAIMVNGEFKCIGSTQHLKNKFSKGLILKIKVRRNTDLEEGSSSTSTSSDETEQTLEQDINRVKAFVEAQFPQAILQEEYQALLTFYIPLSSVSWSKIFGLMERNRDALNVEDYSISQTTLEEIFLEFAKYQREEARQVK